MTHPLFFSLTLTVICSFNMAVRSSLATFIPMLQQAAKQFDEEEGGIYSSQFVGQDKLYNEVRAKLKEYHCG